MARPSIAAVRQLAGFKEPCLVASTANIDIATGGLVALDGVTPEAGARILLKDQTDETENGIYNASEGEWYRAPDAASTRNINKGVMVGVQAGTTLAGNVYVFNTLDPNLGEDDITLSLVDFGAGGPYQPLSSTLTLLSTLSTEDFGRLLLELENADELMALLVYATVADYRASAAGSKILTADLIEGASAFVALADGASIAVDWDSGINFSLTIGGARTLANPTNGQPGTWRTVHVTQDGTGGRTLDFGDQYLFEGGTAPTLTAAAGSIDVLNIQCVTSTSFYVWASLDMQAA